MKGGPLGWERTPHAAAAHAGVYEVEALREGELLLRPVTAVTAADIFDRQGLRPATDAEFAEHFGDPCQRYCDDGR